MLTVYLEAPFAVSRTFTAGWYRPTATFLSPSAAYGLMLNLAGIEMRMREEDIEHPGNVPTTQIRSGLPPLKLALGAPLRRLRGEVPITEADRFPRVQTVYQQLHNYPVGASGGDRAASAFGNKYNITPVRRELLVGLQVLIAVVGEPEVEERIRRGIAGEPSNKRYGLPFLGDNSFLPDRIEVAGQCPPAHWYERVGENEAMIRPRTTRLTVWIDRADLSRTKSDLYSPGSPNDVIPETAWTTIKPP